MKENRMYRENAGSLNPFVGCLHDCIYCKPSFQRFGKMQKCPDCQAFKPHWHPERLVNWNKTIEENQFIFFPSMGDPVFAKKSWLIEMMRFVERKHWVKFLMQTKNPCKLFDQEIYPEEKPSNLMFGATIESNCDTFNTPSKYHNYKEISKAPIPSKRAYKQLNVITIEPILDFDLDPFVQFITYLEPYTWEHLEKHLGIIYVGYDNHHCKLPEPPYYKTLQLITRLRQEGFTVREKSLRPAWYESSLITRKHEDVK